MALARVATLAAAVFAGSVQQGNAAFLQKQELTSQWMNQTAIELRFLQEVRGFVGKGPLDKNIPEIKKALEPMWLALPKTNNGRLGNAQVRYALHRFFIQRHGWHIDGLERAASEHVAGNGQALERRKVPAFLMELFEEAFGKSGLMLHEVAIFAATLERMIHDEATDRLRSVYEAMAMSTQEAVTEAEAKEILEGYMLSLIVGQGTNLTTADEIQRQKTKLQRTYPGWNDMRTWMDDVRETVSYLEQGSANPFQKAAGLDFDRMDRIAQQVSERLGSFQDTDCRQLKDELLEREERETGRVLLSDFYKIGMQGAMQFVERPEYLRQLGVLDETKQGEPRVLVANYVLSKSNCLADMGFYSICCINECEGLLGHIEKSVANHEASPEQLVEIVSHLSSSSVEAPRQLPERLVSQLELVALRHGGKIPLHSRSLAQWLHIAFPRECPYPHAASVSSGLSTSELKKQYKNNKMDVDARTQYIESVEQKEEEDAPCSSGASQTEEELLSQWSHEEEILYQAPQKPGVLKSLASLVGRLVGGVVAVAGVAALGTELMRRVKGVSGSLRPEKVHLV
eukprot:TRINITY_DN428_c0_g2_i2.p1 TRINITY_DN428_c0_g2~~TRINITY_DN428_c0_g2_i2.p1  ORF type:complete len:571 (-),score=205.30 TRINITY_DN428_c0_g2_i2:91-1803(-)